MINFEKILLAFFDIQGYSDFVSNNSYADCIEKTEELLKTVKKDAGDSHLFDIRLKCWILSDPIIVIPDINTRPLDMPAIDFFISICSGLMARGLRAGLPLRGALGAGNFYKNDDIIVSSALIDAARYEKEQNWLGAVITPAALSLINEVCPAFEKEYQTLHNFGRFLDKGKIPWKTRKHSHVNDIPKPEYGFYIKPALPIRDWKRYLPKYFKIDDKIEASDRLYNGI